VDITQAAAVVQLTHSLCVLVVRVAAVKAQKIL
jgi:hypothetical protein